MQDDEIVSLYWERDERAIRETQKKYEKYLMKIANNILGNREDSEESVSDVYLKAWNSIPPQRPENLGVYLARLARGAALDAVRKISALKRRSNSYEISLEELGDTVSSGSVTEDEALAGQLSEALKRFTAALPVQDRNLFVIRYYYMDPIKEAAASCGLTTAAATQRLYRIRRDLKAFLEKEGFET